MHTKKLNRNIIPVKVGNHNAKEIYQWIKDTLKKMNCKVLKRRNVYYPRFPVALRVFNENTERWEPFSIKMEKEKRIKKIVGVQLTVQPKVFLGCYPSHKKQFEKWNTKEILIKIGAADSVNPVNIYHGDRVAIFKEKDEWIIAIKQNRELLDGKFKPHYIQIIRKHQ